MKCCVCGNDTITFDYFLHMNICEKCNLKYKLGHGLLISNEIYYGRERFHIHIYKNDNIKIKKKVICFIGI